MTSCVKHFNNNSLVDVPPSQRSCQLVVLNPLTNSNLADNFTMRL